MSGRVFYPTEYGADPTGEQDSTDAIMSAVDDAFRVQDGKQLLTGINDLGGVAIDLQGGNYKLSKPIRFPPTGGGNLVMHGGTLRASEDFPAGEYLIELWSPKSPRAAVASRTSGEAGPSNSHIYYEGITFRDMLLDSSFRAGGLFVMDSARIRVDNCFLIHYATDGILVVGGHEFFVSTTFLGQHMTIGGDPHESNFSGTAIDLNGNDNALTNVVIFSAATGIILRGQANMLTGVHCYNKATVLGGVGIYVKLPGLSQTRIDNSYLDFTGVVLEDPHQVHITNTFFFGDANILLKSIKGSISGLNIVDNMFSGSEGKIPIVALDESNGPFTTVDQVVVDRNNVLGMQLKSTVGKLNVAGMGDHWTADFSSVLLFPARINHLQYSFYAEGEVKNFFRFFLHAVTNVSNNRVVVQSSWPVDGVVSVAVDQYAMPGEKTLD